MTIGNKGSTYFKKRQPGSEGTGQKTVVRASYACGQGPTAEEATTVANEAPQRMSLAWPKPRGPRRESIECGEGPSMNAARAPLPAHVAEGVRAASVVGREGQRRQCPLWPPRPARPRAPPQELGSGAAGWPW